MPTGDKGDKQKDENKYVAGKAKEKTNVDLSTFKKRDVVAWTKPKKKKTRVSSGGNITFGGSRLGTRMRLQRKKNNRSTK